MVGILENLKTGYSITLLSKEIVIIGFFVGTGGTGGTGGNVMITMLEYPLGISGKCLFAKGFRLAPYFLFFFFFI